MLGFVAHQRCFTSGDSTCTRGRLALLWIELDVMHESLHTHGRGTPGFSAQERANHASKKTEHLTTIALALCCAIAGPTYSMWAELDPGAGGVSSTSLVQNFLAQANVSITEPYGSAAIAVCTYGCNEQISSV
jgi:hypothetical protein